MTMSTSLKMTQGNKTNIWEIKINLCEYDPVPHIQDTESMFMCISLFYFS